MFPLAVGSVSFSVCVNRRSFRCANWPAGLHTAYGGKCAAPFMEYSVYGVRCWCRACVTALFRVAFWAKLSLTKCWVVWCVWLLGGHGLCCCRVSAGDQSTSVLRPVCR